MKPLPISIEDIPQDAISSSTGAYKWVTMTFLESGPRFTQSAIVSCSFQAYREELVKYQTCFIFKISHMIDISTTISGSCNRP